MTPVQLIGNLCRKHFLWLLAAVLLGILDAVCNGLGTALILPATVAFLGLVNPAHLVSGSSSFAALVAPSLMNAQFLLNLVIGLFLLKIIIAPCATSIKLDLMRRIDMEIRLSMLEKLLDADLSIVRAIEPGDVIHRVGYSVKSVATAVGQLVDFTRFAFGVLALFVILIVCSWPLTLLACALFLVLILVSRLTSKKSQQLGHSKTKAASMISIYGKDLIDGIRTVKERGCEIFEMRRLARLLRIAENVNFSSGVYFSLAESVCELAALAILFFAVVALRWSVLLIYLPVLLRLMAALNRLGTICMQLIHSYPELSSICDFLNQTSQSLITGGACQFERLKTGIVLENIKFAHSTAKKAPLFDGLSLTIEKGTTIAIVGISGVGKTTLCDLLLRFYDPDSGRILLDGIDLKEFELGSIRKKIAIISQENFLFNRSLKSNLMLGTRGVAAERFSAAVRIAGLDDVVQRLPKGFGTMIGSRGSSLSLGERQRIAIARAIIVQPEILILDEATGAVDPVMDKQIHAALKQMGPDCTRIIISHRPSTIRQAQVIALLSNGQIAELGSHEELMNRQGTYARLYGEN